MTAWFPTSISSQFRSVLSRLGSRDQKAGPEAGQLPLMQFCEATQTSSPTLSFQKLRLSCLRWELTALFEDSAFPEEVPSFDLDTKGKTPRLLVGNKAVVTIDNQTGYLVFNEEGVRSGLIVVTASEERLIDHIVNHLAARPGMPSPQACNKAASMLVGQTLADVERQLILHTLRHCHGSRPRTAKMLGVSLHTIKNKLREYWRTSEAVGGPR